MCDKLAQKEKIRTKTNKVKQKKGSIKKCIKTKEMGDVQVTYFPFSKINIIYKQQ